MKIVINTFFYIVLFITFILSYIFVCIHFSKYYASKNSDDVYKSKVKTENRSINNLTKYNKNNSTFVNSIQTNESNNDNSYSINISHTINSIYSLNKSKVSNNNNLKKSKYRDYNVFPDNTTVHSSSEYNEGFEFGKGKCDHNTNCFLPYGVCINSTSCICMPDYANIQDHKNHPDFSYFFNYDIKFNNNLFCSYSKKKVVVAALLELFLPLSLGHFYAQQYLLAYIKLFYNFGVYALGFTLYYKGIQDESKFKNVGICLFLFCLIPVWNLIDVQMFLTYAYKDGYGIPMN